MTYSIRNTTFATLNEDTAWVGKALKHRIISTLFDRFFDDEDNEGWMDASEIAADFLRQHYFVNEIDCIPTEDQVRAWTREVALMLTQEEDLKQHTTRCIDHPDSIYPVYQINRKGIAHYIGHNKMDSYQVW